MNEHQGLVARGTAHSRTLQRPHSAFVDDMRRPEAAGTSSPPPPAPLRHSYVPELIYSPLDGADEVSTLQSSSAAVSTQPSAMSDLSIGDLALVTAPEPGTPSAWQHYIWASDQVNWQQRCRQLEAQLQQCRSQNNRVRDILHNKLIELEERVGNSETRANEAERKARLLEQRLADMSISSSPSSSESHHQLNVLRSCVQQRDCAINHLQGEVDEQKRIRLDEAKQVEVKAARIKKWVTNKLKELEEQNQYLRDQNRRCNQQVHLLQCRLSQLNEYRSERRTSVEDSCRGSYEGDRAGSDESLTVSSELHNHISTSSSTTCNPSSIKARSCLDPCSDSSSTIKTGVRAGEVTRGEQKVSCTPTTVPPPVNIERKRFRRRSSTLLARDSTDDVIQQGLPTDVVAEDDEVITDVAAGGGVDVLVSAENRELRVDSGSVDLETPQDLSPNSHVSSSCCPPVTITPSRPPRPARTVENVSTTRSLSLTSTASELKTRREDVVVGRVVVDQGNDYSEIYTPDGSSGSDRSRNHVNNRSRPPTPPLHRLPSWESQLYQMAQRGVSSPYAGSLSSTLSRIPSSSSRAVSITMCGTGGTDSLSTCFSDTQAPVYTSVQGRVSQVEYWTEEGGKVDTSEESSDEDSSTTSPSNHTSCIGYTQPTDNTNNTSTGSLVRRHLRRVSSTESCCGARNKTCSNMSTHTSSSTTSSATNCVSASKEMTDVLASSNCTTAHTESSPGRFHERTACDSLHREPKDLTKSGYLAKLSGRLKTWKKRWFVVHNGKLMYWKCQSDMSKRPSQCEMTLNSDSKVIRRPGGHTFSVSTRERCVYLTCENHSSLDDWVKLLQCVVRREAVTSLLNKHRHEPAVQGCMTRVKQGHSRKLWCMLIDHMLFYFRSADDSNVCGQMNVSECKVEEVAQLTDSEDEEYTCSSSTLSLTIGLFPSPHQNPTYLILPNKAEKDTWLYQLTAVSGCSGVTAGTAFEKRIHRLMEASSCSNNPPAGNNNNNNNSSMLWKDPVLVYCKEPPQHPLTSLPELLHSQALKLYKSCQLFASVLAEVGAIDYHVSLAQHSLYTAISNDWHLYDELIAVLLKQTTRPININISAPSSSSLTSHTDKHAVQNLLMCATQSLFVCDSGGQRSTTSSSPSSPVCSSSSSLLPSPAVITSPSQSQSSTTNHLTNHNNHKTVNGDHHLKQKSPVNTAGSDVCVHELDMRPSYELLQYWQLLALAVSLSAPRAPRLLWLLKHHLQRHQNTTSETGKYASYCQRALERTLQCGGRQMRPSRMEVLSIMLKNPFHHSLPHAIPVHFLNDTYQVIGFDGSTSVSEFVDKLNEEIGCRNTTITGFALFSDDPIKQDVHHALPHDVKLCDVISRWESTLRERGSGRVDNKHVIQLSYRSRLYWAHNSLQETDRERILHVHQTNERIARGHFPLSQHLALELAALLAQMEYGEYSVVSRVRLNVHTSQTIVNKCINRFYPMRYTNNLTAEKQSVLREQFIEKWASMRGRSGVNCCRIYLTCVRQWPHFGATLFKASPVDNTDISVYICCGENSVSILNATTLQDAASYGYETVLTFGGWRENFMLIVAPSLGKTGNYQQHRRIKLLYQMNPSEIVELTLLMADYMSACVGGLVINNSAQTGASHTDTTVDTAEQAATNNLHSANNECDLIKSHMKGGCVSRQ